MPITLFLSAVPYYNKGTRIIEEEATKRSWLHFRFVEEYVDANDTRKVSNVVIQGIPGGPFAGKVYKPSRDVNFIDYGLLTRMPNPFSEPNSDTSAHVVIVGGCHRTAQKALTIWLSKPATLHELCNTYEDKPFQAVLSVRFKPTDSLDPEIIENSINVVQKPTLDIAP